jgi:tetratricopeptide (TPR) repeat protein
MPPSLLVFLERYEVSAPKKYLKRPIKRWLDQLLLALHQDLTYCRIWEAREKKLATAGYEDSRTFGDFVHYAKLNQRLQRKDQAYDLLHKSLNIGFSHEAYLALLQTYSEDGFIEESIKIVRILEKYYEDIGTCVPFELSKSIYKLVAKHGLSKFNQIGKVVNEDNCLQQSIKNIVNWKTFGYDR